MTFGKRQWLWLPTPAPASAQSARPATADVKKDAEKAEAADVANAAPNEETPKPETAANATSPAKPARNPLAPATAPNASAASLDEFLAEETDGTNEAASTEETPDDGQRRVSGKRFRPNIAPE